MRLAAGRLPDPESEVEIWTPIAKSCIRHRPWTHTVMWYAHYVCELATVCVRSISCGVCAAWVYSQRVRGVVCRYYGGGQDVVMNQLVTVYKMTQRARFGSWSYRRGTAL